MQGNTVIAADPAPNGAVPYAALLLDARAVAALLNVSAKTVQRLAARGELPQPIRLGRAVRWSRAAIETFLEARQKETGVG